MERGKGETLRDGHATLGRALDLERSRELCREALEVGEPLVIVSHRIASPGVLDQREELFDASFWKAFAE